MRQHDVLLATATVRETLRFHALLTLPTSVSRQEKLQRVEDVIDQLGEKCMSMRACCLRRVRALHLLVGQRRLVASCNIHPSPRPPSLPRLQRSERAPIQ